MVFSEDAEALLYNRNKKSLAKFSQKTVDSVVALVLKHSYEELIASSLGSTDVFGGFVWCNISESPTDNLILLLAASVTSAVYSHTALPFSDDDGDKLQRVVLRLIQIFEGSHYTNAQRTLAIQAINALICSLKLQVIRRVMAPMFSLASWRALQYKPLAKHGLEQEYKAIEEKRHSMKKKDTIISNILTGFIDSLCTFLCTIDQIDNDNLQLTTSIVQLLSLTLSQLPTRRFLVSVVSQSNVLDVLQTKDSVPSFTASIQILHYYLNFPIDEFTGEMRDTVQSRREHNYKVTQFLAYLYANYKNELGTSILSDSFLDADLKKLASLLSKLDSSKVDKLLIHFEVSTRALETESQKLKALSNYLSVPLSSTQLLSNFNSLPNEESLSEAYTISPLCAPALAPQFLSLSDLLSRTYINLRADSFKGIFDHVNGTLTRFKINAQNAITGASRHAIKLNSYRSEKKSVLSLSSNSTASTELIIPVELSNTQGAFVLEWNAIKEGDIILLAQISNNNQVKSAFGKCGVSKLCSARVKLVSNKNGSSKTANNSKSFVITAETDRFDTDQVEGFNILIKLPENLKNFHRPLSSIESIVDSDDSTLPAWFLEAVLGYGDVNAGDFTKVKSKSSIEVKGLKRETVETALSDYEFITPQDKKRRARGTTTSEYCDVEVYGLQCILTDSTKHTPVEFTPEQTRAIISGSYDGLTLVHGVGCTGKRTVASMVALSNLDNHPLNRTLIIARNGVTLESIVTQLLQFGAPSESVFNLSDSNDQQGKVNFQASRLAEMLTLVDQLAVKLNIEGAYGNDPFSAAIFFKSHIKPQWNQFLQTIKEMKQVSTIIECYPFKSFGDLQFDESLSLKVNMNLALDHFCSLAEFFDEIERLGPLTFLTSTRARDEYLLSTQARIICATMEDLLSNVDLLKTAQIHHDSVIFVEASQLNIFESLYPLLLNDKRKPSSITMLSDELDLGPSVVNSKFCAASGLSTSLFEKFIFDGIAAINLNTVFGSVPEVKYIVVDGVQTEPQPGFFQNLKECEAVIGHVKKHSESGTLAILTPYESQRVVLQMMADDELTERTTVVSTIDGFRGHRMDFVFVSMVRTDGHRFDPKLLHSLQGSATSTLTIMCSASCKQTTHSSFPLTK